MTTAATKTEAGSRRAAVYRLYDGSGVLLYIGSAYDPDWRCKAHHGKSWWPQVVRRTDEWHPNRSVAYAAEYKAIDSEGPAHNRMGTLSYAAECSRRQQAAASGLRLKCKVAADALQVRKRVARELREDGYPEGRAVAEGMIAERAYKEASGAFPNGVNYPPLKWIAQKMAE